MTPSGALCSTPRGPTAVADTTASLEANPEGQTMQSAVRAWVDDLPGPQETEVAQIEHQEP